MKKNILLRLCALLCILLIPISVQANVVVHRAIEPAQILLDVSLRENILTLYLTIPESSIQFLEPNQSSQAIIDLLTHTPELWITQKRAECTLTNHRILAGSHDAPKGVLPDIEGFFEFECLYPKNLTSIYPQLQIPLPGLKLINVWVTTDLWQHKQTLIFPESIVQNRAIQGSAIQNNAIKITPGS